MGASHASATNVFSWKFSHHEWFRLPKSVLQAGESLPPYIIGYPRLSDDTLILSPGPGLHVVQLLTICPHFVVFGIQFQCMLLVFYQEFHIMHAFEMALDPVILSTKLAIASKMSYFYLSQGIHPICKFIDRGRDV